MAVGGNGYSAFFFSSRRRHTRYIGDWSSDVCSSDLFLVPGWAATGVANANGTVSNSGTWNRSEERRVGKECRGRGAPGAEKKRRAGRDEGGGGNARDAAHRRSACGETQRREPPRGTR